MGDVTESKCDRARRLLYRIAAILSLCFFGLGGFICFDSIGSLAEALMKHMHLNSSELSLLYSVNTWPNVVLGFIGGVFIDRFFGIKLAATFFATVTTLGHFLTSFGVIFNVYWLAILGRFIFGAGMEMNMICMNCYMVMWFKNKELSTVMCLITSFSRLGTSIVFEFATHIYKALAHHLEDLKAIGTTYFLIGLFSVASVIFSIIMGKMDSKMNTKPKEINPDSKSDEMHKHKVNFKDILKFSLPYWLAVIEQCVLTTLYLFVPFSQGLFTSQFGLPIESANNMTSFFSILGAVIGPLVGLVVDRIGRVIYVLFLGLTCGLIGNLLMAFSSVTPYVSLVFLSLAFVLSISAVMPLMSFVVPPNQLATAFGTSMSLISGSFSVNVIIAGLLIDKYGYTAMELYMASWAILGLILGVILWFHDRWKKTDMNLSSKQRKLKAKLAQKDESNVPLKAEKNDADNTV